MATERLWACKVCDAVRAGNDRPDSCPTCGAGDNMPGDPKPAFRQVRA